MRACPESNAAAMSEQGGEKFHGEAYEALLRIRKTDRLIALDSELFEIRPSGTFLQLPPYLSSLAPFGQHDPKSTKVRGRLEAIERLLLNLRRLCTTTGRARQVQWRRSRAALEIGDDFRPATDTALMNFDGSRSMLWVM